MVWLYPGLCQGADDSVDKVRGGKLPGADVDGDGLIFLKKMILLPLFNGPADFTQDTITDIDNYAALFGGRDKFSRLDAVIEMGQQDDEFISSHSGGDVFFAQIEAEKRRNEHGSEGGVGRIFIEQASGYRPDNGLRDAPAFQERAAELCVCRHFLPVVEQRRIGNHIFVDEIYE